MLWPNPFGETHTRGNEKLVTRFHVGSQEVVEIVLVHITPGDEEKVVVKMLKNFGMVGSNVAPYTIVAGNPARIIRKRFDDELIDLMLKFRWWDKSIEEIKRLIPLLTDSDLQKVKAELKRMLCLTSI